MVVLPTPPFWFAQAIILAKCFPRRKLSKGFAHLQVVSRGTGAFRTQIVRIAVLSALRRPVTLPFEPIVGIPTFARPDVAGFLFHVKQVRADHGIVFAIDGVL